MSDVAAGVRGRWRDTAGIQTLPSAPDADFELHVFSHIEPPAAADQTGHAPAPIAHE